MGAPSIGVKCFFLVFFQPPNKLRNTAKLINNLDKGCLKQIYHWGIILANTSCISQTW